jgi:UDP-glucuronate decarboxylase
MVSGLTALMDNTADDFTGPVNLGNPAEFTILELAKLVVEMTGSKSAIEFRELPSDDPTRRKPDISLANSVLGWLPKIHLRDGLSETINYLRGVIEQ